VGTRKLYYGEKDHGASYKLATGTTDAKSDGTTQVISFDFRTPHKVLYAPDQVSKIMYHYVRYTSVGTVTCNVSVARAAYQTLNATLPIASTVQAVEIDPIANEEGLSHSLQFTGTGLFTFEGFGFAGEPNGTTRLVSV
jgi:hypothetical protein